MDIRVQASAQRVLHRSASVSIFEVYCRPHDFARGPEECTHVHQIAFPRHGVFEREIRGARALADLNQVLFFWRWGWVKSGAGCRVFPVAVRLEVRETMPHWSAVSWVTPGLEAQWKRYLAEPCGG